MICIPNPEMVLIGLMVAFDRLYLLASSDISMIQKRTKHLVSTPAVHIPGWEKKNDPQSCIKTTPLCTPFNYIHVDLASFRHCWSHALGRSEPQLDCILMLFPDPQWSWGHVWVRLLILSYSVESALLNVIKLSAYSYFFNLSCGLDSQWCTSSG